MKTDHTSAEKTLRFYEVTVEDMMNARERRAAVQERLIGLYGLPVVSFTLNIPGPVKVFRGVPGFFERGVQAVKQALSDAGISILSQESIEEHTGLELIFCADGTPEELKRITSAVEEAEPAGRLYDIDIIRTDRSKVSREDIGLPGRRCLLCSEPAQACARSRRHSLEELTACVRRLILEDSFLNRILQSARMSLIDEVSATPKPGLVDLRDNGSHRDMCFQTFLDSTEAVVPYIREMASEGLHCEDPSLLFGRIRRTGLQAEKAMFRATGGVNTHKGMIFSMGLLAAAAGYQYGRQLSERISGQLPPSASGEWDLSVPDLLSLAGELCREETARDFEALNKRAESRGEDPLCLSHGERLYLKYGCRGIRGEAADGFPSLSQIAYPALTGAAAYAELLRPFPKPSLSLSDRVSQPDRGSLSDSGLDGKWNLVRLQTLLHLMARAEDTNVLHRGGPAAAAYVREEAAALLSGGGVFAEDGLCRLAQLNRDFISRNISPGGCADLLALAVFLLRLSDPGEDSFQVLKSDPAQ